VTTPYDPPYEPHAGSQAMPTQDATHGVGDDRSVGEIFGAITQDLSQMVRSEIDLAKVEAKAEVTKAGKGAGILGAAALAGFFTLFFLSFTLLYLLDNVMDASLAALIVAVLWGIAAAILGLRGKKQLQQVDPKLETTQQTLKEDVQWAKNQKP